MLQYVERTMGILTGVHRGCGGLDGDEAGNLR